MTRSQQDTVEQLELIKTLSGIIGHELIHVLNNYSEAKIKVARIQTALDIISLEALTSGDVEEQKTAKELRNAAVAFLTKQFNEH